MVELLLEYGADVNVTNVIYWTQDTPIMAASGGGHTVVMRVLLKYQAHVNQTDSFGNTALHSAAENNAVQAIELLLQRGADVNQANSYGSTALDLAAEKNAEQAVELLLQRGADVNHVDSYGSTALHLAAWNNAVQAIQLLLRRGANVNQADSNGSTALPFAAVNNAVQAIELLLQRGAGVNLSDSDGYTALHWAAGSNAVHTVELLLQRGADVNLAGSDGNTALHMAAEVDYTECVLMLLMYGADVTLKNRRGKTALKLPEKNKHSTTADAINCFKPNKTSPTHTDQTPSQAVPDLPLSPATPGLPGGYTHVGSNVFANSDGSQVLVTRQLLPINDNQAAAVVGVPYKRVDDPNQIVPLPSNLFMRGSHFSYSAPTQGRPTELELSNLARSIGFEWIQLAMELEVALCVTQQIRMAFPYEPRHQILEMLMTWRVRCQDKTEEDRCRILRRALTNHGKKDLADTI